jgi:zinc protease
VRLGTLGPERTSDEWIPARVLDQVLGGGVAGRLFLDVREQRSLAYSTGSGLTEVVGGSSPFTLSAGTQTAKTGLALQALIEHYQAIGSGVVKPEELELARSYLRDTLLLGVESVSLVTGLASRLTLYGLPDNYYDLYRSKLEAISENALPPAAARYFSRNAVIVVAGDAARLERPLSHFGSVVVLDPQQEFRVLRTIPQDPSASIELDRTEGT